MSGFSFLNKVKIFAGCLFFSGLIFGSGDCAAPNIKELKRLNQSVSSIFEYDFKKLKSLLLNLKVDCKKVTEYINTRRERNPNYNRMAAIDYMRKSFKLLFVFLKEEILADDPISEFFKKESFLFNKTKKLNQERLNNNKDIVVGFAKNGGVAVDKRYVQEFLNGVLSAVCFLIAAVASLPRTYSEAVTVDRNINEKVEEEFENLGNEPSTSN